MTAISGEALAIAAQVLAPLDTGAGNGELQIAVSGTHAVMLIPSWLAGRYAEFTASGATCDIVFGKLITVEVTYGQASSIDSGTKAITPNVKTGRRVVDGTTRSWVVPVSGTATYMAVEASGTGVLSIGLASTKINAKP